MLQPYWILTACNKNQKLAMGPAQLMKIYQGDQLSDTSALTTELQVFPTL